METASFILVYLRKTLLVKWYLNRNLKKKRVGASWISVGHSRQEKQQGQASEKEVCHEYSRTDKEVGTVGVERFDGRMVGDECFSSRSSFRFLP